MTGARTEGARNRGGAYAIVLGALLALVLTGCTGDADSDSDGGPPVTLTAEWSIEGSIEGLNANPQSVGQHHWLTHQSTSSGVGRGTQLHPGPLLLVDARTGENHTHDFEGDLAACLLPEVISDDGVAPVVVGEGDRCDSLLVLDTGTGDELWTEEVDLSYFAATVMVGADDDVVVVTDGEFGHLCFSAGAGKPVDEEDARCTALRDRLTHLDLPLLEDPDGNGVALLPDGSEPSEIGRTDDVLLVHDYVDEVQDDGETLVTTRVVRAHDLETGETLWQDELARDPQPGGAWERNETYFVAPSGVARVSYEHPSGDDVTETPMVVTAVDPRTGDDIRTVARHDGAWFHHQFGDVLIALTGQEEQLQSTISGFRLPTW